MGAPCNGRMVLRTSTAVSEFGFGKHAPNGFAILSRGSPANPSKANMPTRSSTEMVFAGCELVPAARFYRFVDKEDDDISFDPVPLIPGFVSWSVHYGHYLLVGEDENTVY